jgi:dephospho-CoA kinase
MSGERPFRICLTGSLGMGKSRTAGFFAEAGVPVYDSDAAVHALYEGEAVALIENAFPGTTAGGKVDRIKLAAMVLGDAAALARLEALLFETGGQAGCDAVVVVSAPYEMQRRRAFDRPGMTEEKFTALLAKQTPDAEKRLRADFVVDSSQSFDHARAQVRDILRAVAKMRGVAGDS